MSCFGCCEDDDMHKATDHGGQYMMKNPAGINPIHFLISAALCLSIFGKFVSFTSFLLVSVVPSPILSIFDRVEFHLHRK